MKHRKNEDRVKYRYVPTYEYEVDGDVYTVRASSESMMVPDIGDEGKVYYNPANPAEAKTEVGFKNAFAHGLSGVLMFCFGAVFLYFRYKGMKESS